MKKTMIRMLSLATLLLGAAHAGNTSTSATGTAAASSAVGGRAESNAQLSVRAVALLDAQGRVIGTANGAGQFVFQGASRAATRAQVTFRNGVKRTYQLSGSIKAQAQASLETLAVMEGGRSLGLSQAIRTEAQAQANAEAQAAAGRALSGKTVALLGAGGQLVGTFDARGQWQGSLEAAQATDVLVTFENGQRVSYSLTQRLAVDARSAVSLERLQVQANNRSEALLSLLLNGAATSAGKASGMATGNVTTSAEAGAGAAAGTSGSAGTAPGTNGQGGLGVSVGVGVGIGVGVGVGGK